jgi:ribonucleotide reductase alpha subunit
MDSAKKYFKDDDLAFDAWEAKYQLNGESLDDFFIRISKQFSDFDNFKNAINLSEKERGDLSAYGLSRIGIDRYSIFLNLFKNFGLIIPGGSVLAGLGSPKPVSLSNCYVIDTGDSIEKIFNSAKNMAEIYKRRGGVGLDLSNLRPAGAAVNNAANTTGGVVPFMELFSQTTNTIGQEGRRGALMLSIDISHPDSPEFVKIKQDLTKVTGANVSVRLNNNFMKAVEEDSDYILRWPVEKDIHPDRMASISYNQLVEIDTKVYVKKIRAKELWESIIHCAWTSAEPGILFWDNIIDNDPASVYKDFKAVSTNPCQPGWATVLTPFGIKTFNEIKVGDTIWSKDGWTKIINKIDSGVKDVYEYRTTRNVFCGTENHQIVDSGVKTEVKNAKNIDSLQFNLKYDSTWENFKDKQDIIDGLVIGDGSVHKASNNLVFLCIGENDKDYFQSEINSLIIKHREALKKTAYEVTTTISHEELPLLPIREIPERFFKGNRKKVCGFLKGLYSANGSVVDKRITLKTSSSKLRDQVQIMLSSIGINSYFTTNKKKNVEFENGEYECKESYDINISTDRVKFQELIGFLQEYKNDKLNIICQTKNSGRKEVNPIKSIKLISTEEVFDITVDNDSHTYWTGGCNVSNCGEIPLSPYDSCRLIATNLFGLVNSPFTENASIDLDDAYKVFYEAQIIGDILVDLELGAVSKIIAHTTGEEKELWTSIHNIGQKGRRTGVGITALADMLAALGHSYSNSNDFIDQIMSTKMRAELDATIDLSIINGPFPAYNTTNEFSNFESAELTIGNNKWYQFLIDTFPHQFQRMLKYKRRNISFSTIAPTGTISIMAGTSSGCEPVFSLYYTRRKKCNTGEAPDFIDQNGIGFKNYNVVHGKFKEWYEINMPATSTPYEVSLESMSKEELDELIKLSPWYLETSEDISPKDRVMIQSTLQKYTTHSISSTVNLPSTATKDDIATIYTEANKNNLKGITVYRSGSRTGILVKAEVKKTDIVRPVEIPCQVKQFKNERKEWVAFIGILNNMPYEIFTGPKDIDVFPISSNLTEGTIIKVKQSDGTSRYDFRYVDSYGYTNTLGGLSRIFDKEYWNYARFVSALFREGTAMDRVIKVVEGLSFTNKGMNSWKAGLIRSLKEYVPNGTVAHGAICEACGSTNIVYEGGCMVCRDCGSGKCG